MRVQEEKLGGDRQLYCPALYHSIRFPKALLLRGPHPLATSLGVSFWLWAIHTSTLLDSFGTRPVGKLDAENSDK